MTPSLHIAIIPDGNRRWATKRMLDPWEGHRTAVENFRSLTEWCRKDPRVGALTVWCFSTENWKRDPKEIAMLMKMLEEYLAKEREGFIREKTRFVHSGRKDRIPASLAKLIAEVEEETKDQTEFTLNLAVDYGGKDEIVRAISDKPFDRTQDRRSAISDETSLRALLDHPELPDIDLVIRTSGEMRTSNFFLWQTAYSEWEFLDKFFPDFTATDLKDCVDRFAARTRRFGG
ncbi:di-trans,poly-cis-decaprenylcistransferase [Candidatus Peregrinibacteria bacterium]|nr:di-trans,poly-cis-decaprenylcistransferase [Candidatus Peregrinibacteria bacterium]